MGKNTVSNAISIINSLLGIIAAIIPIASAGVALSFNVSPYGAAIIFLLLFAVFFIIVRKAKKSRRLIIRLLEYLYYLITPKKNIVCNKKEIEYTYLNRETISLTVSYSMQLVCNSCEYFEDKLKWSAGPVSTIKHVIEGQEIVPVTKDKMTDIQSQLGYEYFHIKLPKKYTPQDGPIQSGFKIEKLLDPNHKAKTCLIAGVYEKTKQLVLRVSFSPNLKVRNIRKLRYAHFLDSEHYDVENGQLEISENTCYHYIEFKINNPILGGKYSIDWDFIDD